MKPTSAAGALALALCLCAPAMAQDQQTYVYDANGRLIAATTARPTGNGAMASYLPDDADNRLARASMAVSPTTTPDKLVFPFTMLPTQKLTSANGLYKMELERTGDLVIRLISTDAVVWNSCTGQGRTMYARINSTGRLQVYDPQSTVLWTTPNAASAGAELTLQNSGVAVLKSTGGTTLWSSTASCA